MKDRPRMEQRGFFWLDALLYLVVVGVIILSTANLQAATIAIDVDTDANGNTIVAGQIIDDEQVAFGIHIAANNFHLNSNQNMGLAFDPSNPTKGDTDLRSNTQGWIDYRF